MLNNPKIKTKKKFTLSFNKLTVEIYCLSGRSVSKLDQALT